MTDKRNELVPVGSASGFKELIESRRSMIGKQINRKYLTPEVIIDSSLIAFGKNPKLQQCTKGSILQAVIGAAKLGLDLSPYLHHAALVPYGNECVLVPEYGGLIHRAWESDKVRVWADVAYEAEVRNKAFWWKRGLNPDLYHEPLKEAMAQFGGDLGEPAYFYAVARYPDGFKDFTVMPRKEVDMIRDSSQARTGPAWTKWYIQMGKKSAIKRLFKTLALSADVAELVEADNELTGLDDSFLVGNAEVTEEPSEDRSADLAARLTEGKPPGDIVDFPGNGATGTPEDNLTPEQSEPDPEPAEEKKVAGTGSTAPSEPQKRKRGRPAGAKNKPKDKPEPKPEPPATEPPPPDDGDPGAGAEEPVLDLTPTPEWTVDSLIESIQELNTREDFAEWVKEHADHIAELTAEEKPLVQTPFLARQRELKLIPDDTPGQE